MNDVLLDQDTVSRAYLNFKKVFYPDESGDSGRGYYLWNFVGCTRLPTKGAGHSWLFPPEVAAKMRMLAGPDYYAVAKAMEINGARWDVLAEIT